MDSDLKRLRAEAKALTPVLNLGKGGITDGVVAEVQRMLKAKKLIKIKLNQGILVDRKAKGIAKELADRSGAVLVDCVGHVVVLSKSTLPKQVPPRGPKMPAQALSP